MTERSRELRIQEGVRTNEPEPLGRGRFFHIKVQESWRREAEGDVTVETRVTKATGRPGRVDIFVDPDKEDGAIAEIKASDWDRMTPKAVRRNVRRQAKQVWDYVEPQGEKGKSVSLGIIFPKRPLPLSRRAFDHSATCPWPRIALKLTDVH